MRVIKALDTTAQIGSSSGGTRTGRNGLVMATRRVAVSDLSGVFTHPIDTRRAGHTDDLPRLRVAARAKGLAVERVVISPGGDADAMVGRDLPSRTAASA